MKILKRILLVLALIGVLVWIFSDQLLSVIKAPFSQWMKSFPASEYRDSEIEGSYPTLACQNSHVNWGEQVRNTQSLDGEWEIAQGSLGDDIPESFGHRVAVPGFVSEAQAPFSRVGVTSDEREAFWYRTEFTAPDIISISVNKRMNLIMTDKLLPAKRSNYINVIPEFGNFRRGCIRSLVLQRECNQGSSSCCC